MMHIRLIENSLRLASRLGFRRRTTISKAQPWVNADTGTDLLQSFRAERRPGLSLGWRLGISTSIIITAVLVFLTWYQQRLEVKRTLADREAMLRESMLPLAEDIAKAPSLNLMQQRLAQYHEAFDLEGCSEHNAALQDQAGNILASSVTDEEILNAKRMFQAVHPIHSHLLPNGFGILTVWQDEREFQSEKMDRWYFGLLTITVTVICIIVSLQVAHHFLVARPIRQLVQGLRHLEMGYWNDLKISSGAWEIQWLAFRFQKLSAELLETMHRLVTAERRALADMRPGGEEAARNDTTGALASSVTDAGTVIRAASAKTDANAEQKAMFLQYLFDKCRFLESQDIHDPSTLEVARDAWERDSQDAERLGAINLKARFEDAALKIIDPATYGSLNEQVDAMAQSSNSWVKARAAEIQEWFEEQKIPYLEIQYRIKHIGSIWRKMQTKDLTLEQINDVFAFRLILFEETHCYQVLNIIHSHYEPELIRFKDYIAKPKANGYQSIHTTVKMPGELVFEVQIRTVAMHKQALSGNSAHWKYKELTSFAPAQSKTGRGVRGLIGKKAKA